LKKEKTPYRKVANVPGGGIPRILCVKAKASDEVSPEKKFGCGTRGYAEGKKLDASCQKPLRGIKEGRGGGGRGPKEESGKQDQTKSDEGEERKISNFKVWRE